MAKRAIALKTVQVARSARSDAKLVGLSPTTIRRIVEQLDGPQPDFVVGQDDKVYRARAIPRPAGFAYKRKAFARDLYADGWSKRRIAEACGVSPMTIVRDLAGVAPPERVRGTDDKSYPGQQRREAPVIVVDTDGTATVG